MSFDPRHWNLVLPLALAAAACTVRIPSGADAGESSIGLGDESGQDGEDGSPECVDDSDCPSGYYCSNNSCYYEDWCDPQSSPERCSPYECYTDVDCDFASECTPGYYCAAVETPDCLLPLSAMPIPLGEVTPGVLHFARVDDDPEPDLLVITSASVIRIDGIEQAQSIAREPNGGTPVAARSVDLDEDGIDELYVMQDDGLGRLVRVGVSETPIDIEVLDARIGNFMGDATPELVAQTSLDPFGLSLYDITQEPPALLAEISSELNQRGVLVPLSPPDDLDFQDIRFVSYPPWGEWGFAEIAGESEPSFSETLQIFGTQAADDYRSGSGPFTGGDDIPVIVGTTTNHSQLIAPTLGLPPPSATLQGAFAVDDPVIIQPDGEAWVVVLGPEARRIGFDGADFICQAPILGTQGVDQIASGDFDGDGERELVTLDGSQLTLWEFE